ncbi:hypothetical protein IHQ68_05425 [Chelatococcus sambhunathii]|uniref:Uncharacterized protein n=1 Tax=Chelatococcus sambhunathii TaxID=363953 RepID=A0ABU1DD82_9HYPH|nr:hypothetical protein [Chelatococcus sambhunathii]MDR4306061.1 hypothetical protein [Chelatococcus sambhunathii]
MSHPTASQSLAQATPFQTQARASDRQGWPGTPRIALDVAGEIMRVKASPTPFEARSPAPRG